MASNDTGIFIAGLGLLWLLSRKGPASDVGPVVVSGSLGQISVSSGVRMGTHQVEKGFGQQVLNSVTFSVSAKKPDGSFISWPYKFFLQIAKGSDIRYSHMSDPISFPKLDNQTWSGSGWNPVMGSDITPITPGEVLSVTAMLFGATSDSQGNPTNSFTVLASKVHLDAIKVVTLEVLVTGSLGDISVSQGTKRRGFPVLPMPIVRPWTPINAPPPFGGGRSSGAFTPTVATRQIGPTVEPNRGVNSPWLHHQRAPI